MNKIAEGTTVIHSDLIRLFFSEKENGKSDNVKNIINYWIKNGVMKANVVTATTTPMMTTGGGGGGDNKVKKRKKQKKKTSSFIIDPNDIKYSDHIAYVFIKDIILLEYDLRIVGSTLHLFDNMKYGIGLKIMKNLDQLCVFNVIFKLRDKIFDNIKYIQGYPIMQGSKLLNRRMPISIKFNIIMEFHIEFVNSLVEILKNGETLKVIRRNECPKEINERVFHMLTTIEYLVEYSKALKKLLNDIGNSKLNLLKGKYLDDKDKFCNIIETINENVESQILSLRENLKIQEF